MNDMRHEIHILISIAKIDAALNELKAELSKIPSKKDACDRALGEADRSEREAVEHSEAMRKERRALERGLEDNAELIKKYKTQLLEIKTNKEYTALLKEIEVIEKDTDEKEERLLILMDEMEEDEKSNREFLKKVASERDKLRGERAALETREKELISEIEKLDREKPALLNELGEQVRKRYKRILSKQGDFAVTNVVGEICQGCFSRIPPQTANEVKKNDRILTCEACGRILVHY